MRFSAVRFKFGSRRTLLIAGLAAILVLPAFLYYLSLDPVGRAELLLFLGRFHVLIVHLPIGFLVLAALLEIFSRIPKFTYLAPATSFVLCLGAVSAVAAVAAGFMLASGGGYNEVMLTRHMWWGIALALLAVGAYALKIIPDGQKSDLVRYGYGLALAGVVLAVTLAGHFGGSLTHGPDYLTAYMPDPLKTALRIETEDADPFIENISEAVIYADLVYPILDNRCMTCHNPERTEGELRLDSFDLLMRGGESGPVIHHGDPGESELFRRITLPRNHDDRMPPGSRRPLTDTQIEIIRWWIMQGAQPDMLVAEAEIPPEIEPLLAIAAGEATEGDSGIFAEAIHPADAGALRNLSERGVVVAPVSQDHNYLHASFASTSFESGLVERLEGISDQLTWLDLNNTPVEDEDLAVLARMNRLTRLNLSNTSVTDAVLAHVQSLENLEQLNLFGTRVSDDGIDLIAAIPSLRTVFLWQTDVTDEGISRLIESRPDIEIDRGQTLAEPDSIVMPPEDVEDY